MTPENFWDSICRSKRMRLLALLGVLMTLSTAPAAPSTPFFPHAWDGSSGRPSIAFLFIGLALLALAAVCFSGLLASAETLKKWGWLTGAESPVTSRTACAAGAIVFATMAGMIILGWFRVW